MYEDYNYAILHIPTGLWVTDLLNEHGLDWGIPANSALLGKEAYKNCLENLIYINSITHYTEDSITFTPCSDAEFQILSLGEAREIIPTDTSKFTYLDIEKYLDFDS
jgi:hypothetical protein